MIDKPFSDDLFQTLKTGICRTALCLGRGENFEYCQPPSAELVYLEEIFN